MDLYDCAGVHIARLRRNEWTFDDRTQFALRSGPGYVKLLDTRADLVVLEARAVGEDQIHIVKGTFYDHFGKQIEITSEGWRFGGPGVGGTRPKRRAQRIDGTVRQVLPNRTFRVLLDNEQTTLCTMVGKLRRHRFHVVPGDRVTVELSRYDLNRGRIAFWWGEQNRTWLVGAQAVAPPRDS
ncbi:MAG: translation initiation factor IF-1 [Gemmatimonadota bacterium]|nr:MAG: translation initiation factor IF-1 [Gemmatimonadota bacterium]